MIRQRSCSNDLTKCTIQTSTSAAGGNVVQGRAGVFLFGFFCREETMFLLRLVAIIATCLFCVRADGQCKNGRCYQPAFSSARTYRTAPSYRSTGRVTRTRSQLPDGTWGPWKPAKGGDQTSAAKPAKTSATGLLFGEINRDPVAFAHAKREAQMLARGVRGGNMGMHPLGTAPGCSVSGCGQSSGSPNHCYRSWGEHRIVARAKAYGNGRWWWSAHLR